jgi:hypothetical protein
VNFAITFGLRDRIQPMIRFTGDYLPDFTTTQLSLTRAMDLSGWHSKNGGRPIFSFVLFLPDDWYARTYVAPWAIN